MANKKREIMILGEVKLSIAKQKILQTITPEVFIKERKIRGGGTAKYVEGGYVIAMLNKTFSPAGWDFKISDKQISEKEVWVLGSLTIKNPQSDYTIGKEQFGTHERAVGVPLGDTLKAAATDALKKCATLLGLALDVYWQNLDDESIKAIGKNKHSKEGKKESAKPVTYTNAQAFQLAKDRINLENDRTILEKLKEKIGQAVKVYTQAQRFELVKIINAKLGIHKN